jgi:hypothetical protein
VQTRWAQQLHRLLRLYRRKLAVQLPWRPLYDMLRTLFMKPSVAYEGEWRKSSFLWDISGRAGSVAPAARAAKYHARRGV